MTRRGDSGNSGVAWPWRALGASVTTRGVGPKVCEQPHHYDGAGRKEVRLINGASSFSPWKAIMRNTKTLDLLEFKD
jgi:hypothetical protein